MAVRVNKLGLSLIGSNEKGLRVELLYLQLDRILYEQNYTNQRTEYYTTGQCGKTTRLNSFRETRISPRSFSPYKS